MKTQQKIALARIAHAGVTSARRLAGLREMGVFVRRGLTYELDLGEGIDFAIYLLGAFEPRTVATLKRLIKPGFTILDIGANVGAHTLHMARSAGPEGKVLAFEPTAFAYAKLNRNLELNPEVSPRVRAYRLFLTAEDGGAPPEQICSSWPLNGDRPLHPGHLGAANSTDGASSTRLDTLLEREGVHRVDLVKMDVDGFECGVIGGAQEMMVRDKPVFLFEFAPYLLAEQGGTVDQFLSLFIKLNYRFSDADSGSQLSESALRAMDIQGASKNVLAMPER